jgi:EAL domain-containing protein (putative c-di-GMP-specific phosphodiesterase class I)
MYAQSRVRTERASTLPRIAREQIVSLAKLVIDYALQPIVEINTGYVYGYEALMRGYDRLSLGSPADLLDGAADAGVIVSLEQMLHARAIAKFASLPDNKGKKLFLNVDGRVLAAGEAVFGAAATMLNRQGIPASALCFELSEQHDNAAIPEFASVLNGLRGLGARLAIDDFGIGLQLDRARQIGGQTLAERHCVVCGGAVSAYALIFWTSASDTSKFA